MKKFQGLDETKFKKFTKEQMRSITGGTDPFLGDVSGTVPTLTGGKGGCGCTDYGDKD